MTKLTVLLFSAFIFVLNCTRQNSNQLDDMDDSPCVFSNPVISGADPWVFKKDGYYYYIESQNDAIYVSKTKNLTDIGKGLQKVWTTPDEGWNTTNLWAPELHYADGNWYIYYTAGQSGPPFIYQRSGVLKSLSEDAQGEYEDKGMLYTGDNIETGHEHIFIIYSASESWLPAYNLGQLRLKSGNADPMDHESWVKDGPVFEGTGEVYGVGHAGFTLSPDESENWILYHTKVSPDPGWDRVVHMQPFTWNQDGSPHFGVPVQPGERLAKPSGECGE